MKWTGKIVGGLLGLFAGPWGGLIGMLLGHQFDVASNGPWPVGGANENLAVIRERLFRSTFRVMGFLAKADGRVSEAEINAARHMMSELALDPTQVMTAIEYFNAGKQPGFNLLQELNSLHNVCARRPDVLRVFVELQVRAALAGNNMEGPVRTHLHRIAAKLGVSAVEVAQMEAVMRIRSGGGYHHEVRQERSAATRLEEAYRVLEIEPAVNDNEIVRAYRRQLSRHHPDKLKANGLPESMIEHAKQRTQQVIEAYELIRERRGMT